MAARKLKLRKSNGHRGNGHHRRSKTKAIARSLENMYASSYKGAKKHPYTLAGVLLGAASSIFIWYRFIK